MAFGDTFGFATVQGRAPAGFPVCSRSFWSLALA